MPTFGGIGFGSNPTWATFNEAASTGVTFSTLTNPYSNGKNYRLAAITSSGTLAISSGFVRLLLVGAGEHTGSVNGGAGGTTLDRCVVINAGSYTATVGSTSNAASTLGSYSSAGAGYTQQSGGGFGYGGYVPGGPGQSGMVSDITGSRVVYGSGGGGGAVWSGSGGAGGSGAGNGGNGGTQQYGTDAYGRPGGSGTANRGGGSGGWGGNSANVSGKNGQSEPTFGTGVIYAQVELPS